MLVYGVCSILDHESTALASVWMQWLICRVRRPRLTWLRLVPWTLEMASLQGGDWCCRRHEVHSATRVSLNSREEVYEVDAIAAVLALSAALQNLGKSSLCRAKANLDAVGNESLKTGLLSMFEKPCPNENVLRNAYRLVLDSDFEEDTGKFVHEVNALLGTVWSIVAWEVITAFCCT
ncbi:hypothetical protein GH714_013424 [Hevea brasiliensis]|uniref:Uncharacterized protein n=1 Tax=Hevea brasiliensis TaxID=3981 RepID=A0A6A6KNC3_HEVBR|nr:hypothetical protein GH714_013424 [Hevea brasiliensis]